MLAGITFSIFREHKFLSSGSACRRLVRGIVEDSIPGLHAVGILTVLRQDSFQGSLESVNQRDSTNIPTKNEVCALVQSNGDHDLSVLL